MRRGLPPTQSGRTIAALIAQYRIRPNRLRGQHFLVDDEVYERIIEAASLSSSDVVVEVGAGLGTLTERLVEVAGQVIGVEVDEKLARILHHRFSKNENVEIIHDDILSTAVDELTTEPYRVVANVPYYLTGALFRKFLAEDRQPQSMVVLIQREVAERVTAASGDFTLAAIGVQLYGTPEIIRLVPPESFFPPPEVESALLRVSNIHSFPFHDISEKFFWRVARVGFSSPRKQLKNNIQAGFPELDTKKLERIFLSTKISPTTRAQDLFIDDWHHLTREIEKLGTLV